MSWRVKLAIGFVALWAMGTVNERLDSDRTFNPPPAPAGFQQERQCAEDELLDVRSMTCIHSEIIEMGYYNNK